MESINERINKNAENSVHLIFYKSNTKRFLGCGYMEVMIVSVRESLMRKVAKKLFDLGFDCNLSHIPELRDIFKGKE